MIDPHSTCQNCQFYGLHHIGARYAVTEDQTEHVTISTWQGITFDRRIGATPGYYRTRQCMMCGHSWRELDSNLPAQIR